ncbi:MAG: hypothetical protein NT144_11525 [Bacteroidia bacterium]|nr:hypothetical protein [Bacteroidia bacterium]
MKKLIFSTLFLLIVIVAQAQNNKADLLQELEKSQPAIQNVNTTATLTSSSRLFGAQDDLTSVILIIPSGSNVTVLGSDSTYLHVAFEENEGFIFKRHAVIDKTPVNTSHTVQYQQPVQQEQPAQAQEVSRFSYLESKYGSGMAARLIAGKIWKGMNVEMVKDSWGTAEKINRVISGNIIKEEWIFKTTWLYFENNSLVEWGPKGK